MTDQTTAPPQTAPRPEDDPVWRRLVTDYAAFQRQYPTPAHLAELVKQAINAGFELGIRHGTFAPSIARPPRPENVVADAMNWAATPPGAKAMAALHALAHAGQRARAHVATAADTGETTTGGRSDG